jgi:hypothetical protein
MIDIREENDTMPQAKFKISVNDGLFLRSQTFVTVSFWSKIVK